VGNIVLGSSAVEILLGLGLAKDSGSIHQLVYIYIYTYMYMYLYTYMYGYVYTCVG